MAPNITRRSGGVPFLVPAMVLFGVFVAYPVIFTFQSSLLDWDGLRQGTFIGLGNYAEFFRDPVFGISLRNSAWWILLTVFPQMFVGFGLAWLLNRKLRGRNIYRAIFFVPAVLSPVVVSIVWRRIYDPFSGVLRGIDNAFGIDWLAGPWLAQSSTAIFAVILVNVWMWTGFSMLFYLAGLQGIDPDLFDAAYVDGATGWELVRRIVWPLLRSTHLSLILLGIIGSMRTFELVFLLTGGGPNHQSELLATYTFQQGFQVFRVGYASSISMVLIVVSLGATALLMITFGSSFISGDDRQ